MTNASGQVFEPHSVRDDPDIVVLFHCEFRPPVDPNYVRRRMAETKLLYRRCGIPAYYAVEGENYFVVAPKKGT